MIQTLSTGDWVRCYEPGIWQVYRISSYLAWDPVSRSEKRRTSVFSKRCVNDAFKPAFRTDSCDASLVEPLDAATSNTLTDFLSDNVELHQAFRDYEPEPINLIHNARIGIPDGMTAEDVTARLDNNLALRQSEIGDALRQAGFKLNVVPYWTAQFISRNYEIVDDHLVFRFLRVLDR